MRVAPAFFALMATGLATAQSFDWQQSPTSPTLFAVTQPMTWSQARSLARSIGGDLAVVTSAIEQTWLYETFGKNQCLWIGYTDEASEGAWQWVGGASSTYANWAVGQPDNQGGAEHWAAISPEIGRPFGAGGRWLDMPSGFVCPAILELDAAALARVTPVGSGCAGSNGPPTMEPQSGMPVPGSWFTLHFASLPATQNVLFAAFGHPRPAPIDLTAYGMPGCPWYPDQVFVTMLNAQSVGTSFDWTFFVHPTPALRGVTMNAQALVLDLGVNQAGFSVTNALALRFGTTGGEVSRAENFFDDQFLDREGSGGTWSQGLASFAAIGGDARHGTFSPDLGTYLGVIGGLHTYEIDTDATIIPGEQTLTGAPITVTDGRFFFDEMVVPADVRLQFVGSNPPQFTVAGQIEIFGEVDVQGESLDYPLNFTSSIGQDGGAGGIFGGAGGAGADRCIGSGQPLNYHGEDGNAANVLAGHAYAGSAAGTGGEGSSVFPVDGLNSSIYVALPTGILWTPMAGAGGGGGGLWTAGGDGLVLSNNHPDPGTGLPPLLAAMGPPAPGGQALPLFPLPSGPGAQPSSAHFLVGGAGGGGGGSHTALGLVIMPSGPNVNVWAAGAGGGGGGGALALRAGDLLELDVNAALLATGGAAGTYVSSLVTSSRSAPGGGGSGGSIVLQSGGTVDLRGAIDVRGGAGGDSDISTTATYQPPQGGAVHTKGGDGGGGFVRLELPGTPTPALLPGLQPTPVAENVGPLAEVDTLASMQSRFYPTFAEPAPSYVRYVVDASIDGVPMVFSDDPNVSTMTASIGAPLQIWLQGARLDPQSMDPIELGPWRAAVRSVAGAPGLDADDLEAFRFRLVVDRTLASSVSVQRVQVVYRLDR